MKKIIRMLASVSLVLVLALSSVIAVTAESTNDATQTENVRLTIPEAVATNIKNYTFSIREKGTQSWTDHGLYSISSGLQVNLKLEVNTEYEYTLNYINNKTYYKLIGSSLRVDEAGLLHHQTAENGLVTENRVENDNESYWEITQVKNPRDHEYSASRTLLFQVNPEDAIFNLRVSDTDGSKLPIELGFFSTMYLPSYKTDASYDYEIQQPGYHTARGTIIHDNDGVQVTDVEGHTVDYSGPFLRIALERSIESVDVVLGNVMSGTDITATTQDEQTVLKVENNRINVDLGGQSESTIHVSLKLENYVDVTMVLLVNADGSVIIQNEADLQTTVKNLSVEGLTINFNQIRRSPITPHGDGSATASFGSLRELFVHEGTIYPGDVRSGSFRVVNETDARYRLIDAKVRPTLTTINENSMFRTGSDAIRSYYEHFNPDYVIKPGSAEYLFDFEGINGISLYDGLLKEFQRTNPNLERLEDLDASILASIFSTEYEFFVPNWEGNPNADYAVQLATNKYAIKETDPKMIALAQHHLFSNALYMSFDTQQTGPLNGVSTANDNVLKFASYEARTEANVAMMDQLFDQVGILEPHSYVDFDHFAYMLAGDLVHDAFRPAFNTFDFAFDLRLGVVGVDGYAFHDLDRDGYQDDIETPMAGIKLELMSGNSVVASTETSDTGYYAFPNVASGSYKLKVTTPDNYEITGMVNALLGNRFDANGLSETFTVMDDENYHYRVGFVTPNPVKEGIVEANHVLVDDQGNVIRTIETDILTGNVGTAYSVDEKIYSNYDFVKHEGASKQGLFTEETQVMTFFYKAKEGILTIDYRDEKGNKIVDSKQESYRFMDSYTVAISEIDGYSFIKVDDNSAPLNGTINRQQTHVILIYAKDDIPVIPDKVILEVNYVDESGVVIANQQITSHSLNTAYTVNPMHIEGYTFNAIDTNSAPLKGTLEGPRTVVTLVYSKDDVKKPILPPTGVSQNYVGYMILTVGVLTGASALILRRRHSKYRA